METEIMSVEYKSENIISVDPDFDTYICPVYLTDLEGDARTINCGHTFSSRFIEEVYKKAIRECPLCRTPITYVSENNNYSLKEALGDVKALRRENMEVKDINKNLIANTEILIRENKELKAKVHTLESLLENLNDNLEKISFAFTHVHEKINILEEDNKKLNQQREEDKVKYENLYASFQKEADEKLSSQRHEDQVNYNNLRVSLEEKNEKCEKLEKKLNEETAHLKATIASKEHPTYYFSSSSSSSDKDYTHKKKIKRKNSQQQIVVRNNQGRNINGCANKLAHAFLSAFTC